MNLHPNNPDIKCHHSMYHVAAETHAGNEHYSLAEVAVGHLLIRFPESNIKDAAKAIKSVTKLSVPRTLESESNADYSLYWIAPDEYLLLVPEKTEYQVETKLRKAIQGHFAIVDVTGGQTLLALTGKRAESILKKSAVYDIHPNNFPIGKVVTTTFAKSQTILTRISEDSFHLIIRRSFSDYCWQWIVDAGSRA